MKCLSIWTLDDGENMSWWLQRSKQQLPNHSDQGRQAQGGVYGLIWQKKTLFESQGGSRCESEWIRSAKKTHFLVSCFAADSVLLIRANQHLIDCPYFPKWGKRQVVGYSLFIYQDENEYKDKNQSYRSFLYVLKQTCDEQTKNYMWCNTKGLVRSLQELSRTNENFRSRFRFCLRLGTWSGY